MVTKDGLLPENESNHSILIQKIILEIKIFNGRVTLADKDTGPRPMI